MGFCKIRIARYVLVILSKVDTYDIIGLFLHQNYIQALEILEEMPAEINMLTGGRMIADAQYVKWLNEERLYLESKQKEPEVETFKIDYIELLQKYEEAR